MSRETHRGYAAAWSDATASVYLEELHSASSSRGMQIVEFMLVVFSDTTACYERLRSAEREKVVLASAFPPSNTVTI